MNKIDQLINLAKYYRDLLKSLSVHSGKHFVDIGTVLRYGLTADLSLFVREIEELITNDTITFTIEKASPKDVSKIIEKANKIEEKEEQEGNTEDTEADFEEQERKNASAIIVAIYRKQEFDPYNRETIIGFPLISGNLNNKKFCAPLFYYKVRIDFNPLNNQITLAKNHEVPELNSQLMKHLFESDEEIEMVRHHILPILEQENFDLPTIKKIIKILSELVEGFRGMTYPSQVSMLRNALESREHSGTKIFDTSIIVNASRTMANLIDDLDKIVQMTEINQKTVIETILSEPVDAENIEDIDDTWTRKDQSIPLFPLLSNKSQRLAAIKAEKSRLLVIHGPPGTGKSQTIVNLICHLVSQGKTVLVTSHQNKALEVITKNMPKPKVDYLEMSLLKGEKQSIDELINKIDGIHSYIGSVSINEYTSQIQTYKENLSKKTEDIKRLQSRFSELKILERDQYCSYRKYHEIREYDLIDHSDTIPEGKDSIVGRALSEYSNLLQKLKETYTEIEEILPVYDSSLSDEDYLVIQCNACNTRNKVAKEKLQVNIECKCGKCGETLNITDSGIEAAINSIEKLIHAYDWVKDNIFPDKSTLEFCKCILDFNHNDTIKYLEDIIQWANKHCSEMIENLKWFSESHRLETDFITIKKNIARYGNEVEDIRRCIENISGKLQSIGEYNTTENYHEYPDIHFLEELTTHIETLSNKAHSWWKWHLFGKAKKSRKYFTSKKFPKIIYKKRFEILEKIKAWHNHWTVRNQIAKDIKYLIEFDIPLNSLSPKPTLGEIYKNVTVAQRYSQIIVAFKRLPFICLDTVRDAIEIKIANISSYKDISTLVNCLEKTRNYIETTTNLNKLKLNGHFDHLCNTLLSPVLKTICLLYTTPKAGEIIHRLKELHPCFSDYKRLKILEVTHLKTLPKTCGKLKDEVLKGNDMQALEKLELIVEAFRLSSFIREDILKNPDDINEVAKSINRLKEDSRKLILKILDTSRRLALKKAVDNPAILFVITKLKQLLKRKRKTHSFVQLKNQIDYKKLLSVFPCWIMSIEDVARIFPLEAGLFDYLIVDEASQCNQATALHLAYRAQQMIVVGDEKQMKNPNTQFLSDAVVRLNLTKHGLDIHPKAEFLHGRKSLLDLATGCQDTSPVFLNEHFRCEPPIISFSNEKFYNNSLGILTPFRKKRFKPCMEVRIVSGAYDDPEDKKQNIIEAQSVIEGLKRMIDNGELEGDRKGEKLTVGILSPFRQQASLLQSLMHEVFDECPSVIKEHEIIASTVDGFQGDERDVILYSFRYAPNSKPGTIIVLQRLDEHSLGRLNVATNRARRKVVCFISMPIDKFPNGLIKDFLRHAVVEQKGPYSRFGNPNEKVKCQSDFERAVFDELAKRQLEIYAQVPCAGFFIDFVVFDREGRRMAVECDGEFHYEEGELREEDYQRQDIIERYGWFVHRIPSRHYYANPEKAINNLLDNLRQQEVDKEICGF
jgi:very-short-patch-repair endonuclease